MSEPDMVCPSCSQPTWDSAAELRAAADGWKMWDVSKQLEKVKIIVDRLERDEWLRHLDEPPEMRGHCNLCGSPISINDSADYYGRVIKTMHEGIKEVIDARINQDDMDHWDWAKDVAETRDLLLQRVENDGWNGNGEEMVDLFSEVLEQIAAVLRVRLFPPPGTAN